MTALPEDPTPAMLHRGATVFMHATGSPETIVHDVWQAMYDEWQYATHQVPRDTEFDGNTMRKPEEPYFLDRAYGEIQARFDALVDELTDANAEIASLRKLRKLLDQED